MNINLLPKELRRPEPPVTAVKPNIQYTNPARKQTVVKQPAKANGAVAGRMPWYQRLLGYVLPGRSAHNSTARPTVGVSPVPAPITPAAPHTTKE